MSPDKTKYSQPMRLIAVLRNLWPKPFDTNSSEDRARERHRRAALTTMASVLAHGTRLLTVFVSVPLTISYLGNERYGLWLTISSTLAFFSFADLGIGNGLLNMISEADGKDDRNSAIQAVSSAFFLLAALSVSFGALFFWLYEYIPWLRIFNISSPEAIREAGPAMVVFVACFLINMPLGIVQRIQMGFQEGFSSNIWQALGSVLALLGVLAVIELGLGLPWLVLAFAGAPVIATVLNGLYIFNSKYSWLRPQLRKVSYVTAKRVMNLGVLFFTLQISLAIAFSSDNFVIAQILGADAVVEYGVPKRLFGLVVLIVGFVLTPFWPAYGEAFSRQDNAWIKNTLTSTLKGTLILVGPASVLLVLFGKPLIDFWIGEVIQPSTVLLLGLGLWTVVNSFGRAITMFLNGTGIIRVQTLLTVLMAIANLALSISLCRKIGVAGPIWGTVISYTFVLVIPSYLYVRKVLERFPNLGHAAG